MYNHILYLGYWLANSSLFFLLAFVVSDNIVLGNGRFTSFESAFYAGFWMTFGIWVWWDLAIAREWSLDKTAYVLGFFLFANTFSLLAVTQFKDITGLTVISYQWIGIVAVAATLLQRVVWRLIVKRGY